MIDKNKIFKSNELFKFKTDFSSVNYIESKIRYTENVIKYTNHTVRLHQNKKRLVELEEELMMSIYNHNKFDLFEVISKEIDKALEKRLKEEFWD